MEEPLIAHVLRGRTVLVIHEERFRGEYLAEVLRGADATVAGPVETASTGIALLATMERGAVMVLSSSITGSEALFERAAAKSLATLLVHPPRTTSPIATATLPYLASPYAGFQVVEALARLLASEQSHEEQRIRPCPRGH